MNDFVDVVNANKYGHLLETHSYLNFRPKGNDQLTEAIKDIVDNNLKVMIDPDTDPDGYLAGLIVKESLDLMGHENYTVNTHTHKRHGITKDEVLRAINEAYDYVIIVDSSTNMMETIELLTTHKVKVIIIDHHQTSYVADDYPEGALVINCTMKDREQSYSTLSACALVAILFNNTLTDMDKEPQDKYMLYAYVTLYSDSCDLSSEVNVSIIHLAENLKREVPRWMEVFMTQWDSLNRSFIEFKLVPRLNALIRRNMFDMVDTLLYKSEFSTDTLMTKIVTFVESNYKDTKQLTEQLSKLVDVTEYEKFVIADMDSAIKSLALERSEARNFTGLVASKVMQEYGKTTMLLMDMHTNLQGSVRDPFNRDILKVFKQFLTAGGHKAAFGVSLNKNELSFVIENLNLYDNLLELNESKSIIIDGDLTEDLDIQIRIMGEYNELSGGSVPVGYIKKVVDTDCTVIRKKNYTKIKWGEYNVTSFTDNIFYQDVMIIKPTKNKTGYQLLVNNVI